MQNMQYEKTSNKSIKNDQLENIKISCDKTYHHLNNVPLYDARFLSIEKFHKPGLAPVYDQSGGYHIDLSGKQAYINRFQKVFGFYYNKAAVISENTYFHIDIAGNRFYQNSYEWVGNYQENKCVVKKDNKFFHIDINGNELYSNKYNYVGDFKDDIAVVHKSGRASHINSSGELLHDKWFKNLCIYHKGYASAEDEEGCFHIDITGNPIYVNRYKMVEPFYNGLALDENFDGYLGQIDVSGQMINIIYAPSSDMKMHEISRELVGFWPTYLINAAVELKLLEALPQKIGILCEILNINEQNLQRILRALWEIKLITYDKTNEKWQATTKGQFLLDNPFMFKAVKMWSKVIIEKNWLKIPELLRKTYINSFPTFKEREPFKDLHIEFYQALLSYTEIDVKNFVEVEIKVDSKILLVGIHSGALIPILKDKNIKIIDYYNNHPQLPEQITCNFGVKILNQHLDKQYDIAILTRYLQNMDDLKVMEYFKLLQKSRIPRILLIETVLVENMPMGGIIDISIMVESGGRLRTEKEWQLLLLGCGEHLKIVNIISLTNYLSVIDIRNMKA